MWSYVARRLVYFVPVYLAIILMVMAMLRVQDPVYAYLGKAVTEREIELKRQEFGLDRPFIVQYADFVTDVFTFDLSERSWEQQRPVGAMIAAAIPPTLFITVPALVLTAAISIAIGLVCSYTRGRFLDRTLIFAAVLGMSISYLVYIIMGQYFGAYWLPAETGVDIFAVEGYEPVIALEEARAPIAELGDAQELPPAADGNPEWWNPTDWKLSPANWVRFCLLPVLINVIVAMGYDTRFYRTVMVEESSRDYITTAKAKGAGTGKILFVHMLKNAMIPIITRVMITLPFLIIGSVLMEMYFSIPGMGRTMITAIYAKDFPVVQATAAIFAGVVILTVILTDVLYALVDPRVRLQ